MSEQINKRLGGLGLPDDLVDVALADEPGPTPEAVERIKQRALARAMAQPVGAPKARRRPTIWLAAAAAALLLAFGVVGPARVIAAVQQLLAYVPGFGLQERGAVQLAAEQTVREVRGDQAVEVLGLQASEQSVSVRFKTRGFVIDKEQVSLVDDSGQPLASGAHSLMTAYGVENIAEGWFTFAWPGNPEAKQFTLIIAGEPEWRVAIPVVPSAGLAGLEQFGQTVTANGYTFAGRLLAGEDQTEIVLLARGVEPGSRISRLGTYWGDLPATRMPSLQAGDQTLPLDEDGSAGDMRRLIAGPVPAGIDRVTLSIPVMKVMERGKASIRLTVADQDLNQRMEFGEVGLTVTRTEVIDGMLRIYADPGPRAPVIFGTYGLLELDGKPVSSSAEHDEATGLIQYFEVEIPVGAKSMTLTMHDPTIFVEGPWILDLPVERP